MLRGSSNEYKRTYPTAQTVTSPEVNVVVNGSIIQYQINYYFFTIKFILPSKIPFMA